MGVGIWDPKMLLLTLCEGSHVGKVERERQTDSGRGLDAILPMLFRHNFKQDKVLLISSELHQRGQRARETLLYSCEFLPFSLEH